MFEFIRFMVYGKRLLPAIGKGIKALTTVHRRDVQKNYALKSRSSPGLKTLFVASFYIYLYMTITLIQVSGIKTDLYVNDLLRKAFVISNL